MSTRKQLKQLVEARRGVLVPGAFNALSAKVVEDLGFEAIYVTGAGVTNIFIYPGYTFQVVNALVTNFHLPQSTLMMLVSALAGRERMLDVYRQAVEEKYRFFSFGDAMFIY